MRTARILPADTVITFGDKGTLYAKSPHALGSYPGRITERLEHWAAEAPHRTFLARRDAAGAWRGVTYAEALSRVRRLAQSLIDRRLSAERPVVILSGNSVEQLLHQKDARRLINQALGQLPPEFREVIVLREMEELSYKEIAAIANIPIGTVMSRLARARKLLLHSLRQLGGES